MLEWALSTLLWFVTYVEPLILGARICKSETSKPADVLNITLAIVLVWLAEFLDSLILGRLIAMRSLYILCRVALAWYWMHPRLQGALRLYQKYLQAIIEEHAATIDSVITSHVKEARESGPITYLTRVVSFAARSAHGVVTDALDTSTTKVE